MNKPKITVIGGGTGIPVILRSLRHKDVDITAVVTVADDGGSSGNLRDIMQLTPPGDLRNVLVAMSDMPKLYERVFQYRFDKTDGALAGHPLGNLVIAGISEMQGSTYNAMQLLTKFFHVTGKIYPASETALTLHAVFRDGHEVVNAILNSDMIVLGPGSLYTSILPNLVIPEIRQALIDTKADVTYICNIMTQYGETEQFSDADHVAVLNRHLGSDVIDNVLVNIEKVPLEYMMNNKFDEYLVQVDHDFNGLRREAKTVVSSNFLRLENGGAFHDGDLVVEELMHLVRKKS